MIDSANTEVAAAPASPPTPATPGLREQRKQRTTLALIQRSRDLTFDRGLSGFTVDELCQDVGVSRRTFFNYFASKEHAVLGLSLRNTFEPGAAIFLGSDQSDLELSGSLQAPLLDAIVELILASSRVSIDHDFTVEQMWELLSREPSLLARLNASAIERSQELANLIQVREGLALQDPYAEVAASLSLHLAMTAFMECSDLFQPGAHKTCPDHGASCDKFEHFEAKLRQKFSLANQFFTA
ncbi:TetR/AcrR family transcriptional regulator [Jonesiaceae bacterium BS-20]|uniref:TetR/AcrR family transcriptional regulator n=1 Tax=Jonesiaceae bacterium BS-20 TaxID=3120821 RepID=A0AAU7DUX6_9MICO